MEVTGGEAFFRDFLFLNFVLMLHFVFYEANAYTSITGVVSNTVTFVFRSFVAWGTC